VLLEGRGEMRRKWRRRRSLEGCLNAVRMVNHRIRDLDGDGVLWAVHISSSSRSRCRIFSVAVVVLVMRMLVMVKKMMMMLWLDIVLGLVVPFGPCGFNAASHVSVGKGEGLAQSPKRDNRDKSGKRDKRDKLCCK